MEFIPIDGQTFAMPGPGRASRHRRREHYARDSHQIRAAFAVACGISLLPAIAILAYDEYLFRQRYSAGIQEERVPRGFPSSPSKSTRRSGRQDVNAVCWARLPAIQAMDGTSRPVLAEILRNRPTHESRHRRCLGRSSRARCLHGRTSVSDRVFFRQRSRQEVRDRRVLPDPISPGRA